MTNYVFPPHDPVTLPVRGSDKLFPVRRVYCVARNYEAHAVEMGHDPNKEPPFFFQKNPENICKPGTNFPYPSQSKDVHHEIELVVALAKGGKNIPQAEALEYVYGYGIGLDMTLRDIQGTAKKAGRPWESAKAFDHSAPCSEIIPANTISHPRKGKIWLDVNGTQTQEGNLNQLIWKVPEIIAYLSAQFALSAGDLIFTGTPSGVGAINTGDQLVGGVDGVGEISVKVV
ncbi:MAG: fumarylacetoacetate hydrolase family protein [Rhodospirillales bacterium]|nr:fumarylacetoacetate hydrolase family protein [Rhodospirillales bacterium]